MRGLHLACGAVSLACTLAWACAGCAWANAPRPLAAAALVAPACCAALAWTFRVPARAAPRRPRVWAGLRRAAGARVVRDAAAAGAALLCAAPRWAWAVDAGGTALLLARDAGADAGADAATARAWLAWDAWHLAARAALPVAAEDALYARLACEQLVPLWVVLAKRAGRPALPARAIAATALVGAAAPLLLAARA